MARKRFTSGRSARQFAERVNGKVNDLRDDPKAKSKFTVTYDKTKETKLHAQMDNDTSNWSPEDDRDFGWPNEFWK